ncbi:polymerase delta-interacting protein 3-like isoform X2 [Diorhabda carinulata]|uniref:polymerase delta-interacting protein 3-like isoform X2 n=1 Tax=Diorhabda carinulata TaxID=1163345 RepID=UPI0025A0A235|nr:polymerase delta-interacting protein 3-like isoform X2 [Diorhabda carinulata]
MSKHRTGNKSGKYRTQKSQIFQSPKNGIIRKSVKNRQASAKGRMRNSRKLQDARQKILLKKKKTVTDARDILTKMAKSQDARTKINKIRDDRSGPSTSENVKVIGKNILKKTDRNGKISLVTNKARQKLDINFAIQKQLGLLPNNRSPPKRPVPKRNAAVNTVRSPSREYDPSLYRWTRPESRNRAAIELNNSLEATRQVMREALREELSNGWPTFASHNSYQKMSGIYAKGPLRSTHAPIRSTSRLQTGTYIDLANVEDEEMPLAPLPPARPITVSLQGTSRVTNVHSRLDDSVPPESHGIFSTAKTKVVVPAGHRIVVSNLQPTVTQDDIKELFEDIGQLLTAKLVRPGVAEVIYKNLKDAQKAVDTYHNRQLDGQPMKCLLVNKRPLNYPTAPPLTKNELSVTTRKGGEVPSSPPNNKLVPDINTIHKVLFHKK